MLLALRDAYNSRTAAGVHSNAAEATLAINCIDEKRLTTDGATALVGKINAVAPFMDPGIDVETHDGCEGWSQDSTLDFPYGTDIDGPAGDALLALRNGVHDVVSFGSSLFGSW